MLVNAFEEIRNMSFSPNLDLTTFNLRKPSLPPGAQQQRVEGLQQRRDSVGVSPAESAACTSEKICAVN